MGSKHERIHIQMVREFTRIEGTVEGKKTKEKTSLTDEEIASGYEPATDLTPFRPVCCIMQLHQYLKDLHLIYSLLPLRIPSGHGRAN